MNALVAVVRGFGAAVLILFAAFCGFGFLASFEPGPYLVFRVGYPVLGVVALAGAWWLARR